MDKSRAKKTAAVIVSALIKAKQKFIYRPTKKSKLLHPRVLILAPFVVFMKFTTLKNWLYFSVTKWWNTGNSKKKAIYTDDISDIGKGMAKEVYESYNTIQFENHSFMCIERYDELLRYYYGNYMELPKEIKIHHQNLFNRNNANDL